jgi:aminoglycoside N3'-acetyltransferase
MRLILDPNHFTDFILKSINQLGKPYSPVLIFSDLFKHRFLKRDYYQLLKILKSELPNNPVLLPGYTYSSRRSEVFDLNVSPDPQNGSLSRVLFEQTEIPFLRTYDVDYSYLVMNPNSLKENSTIFSHSKKSFGEGSHHERIFEMDPILIAIGNGFSAGFTPAMHAEALATVPYRKYLETRCYMPDGAIQEKSYFARDEAIAVTTSRKHMYELFVDSSENLTEFHENHLVNVSVNGKYFINQLTTTLREDPNYFIK